VSAVFAARIAPKRLILEPDGQNPGAARAMLCFPQMATKAQITAEQYLHTTFEHDAEFVRGEIVERSMPTYLHGRIQAMLSSLFEAVRSPHRLFPCSEVRMKLAPDVYRIPDVAVFVQPPGEVVPDRAPLVVVEILSPDDRHHDLMEKLEEYRVWGVPNIWVVDPISKRLAMYSTLGLQYASSLALAEYPLELTPAVLFSDF
jgi:Uma2 family endonuclease